MMYTINRTPAFCLTLAMAVTLLAGSMIPASAKGYQVGRTAHIVGVASWDHLNIRKWPAPYSAKVGSAAPYAEVWVERCIIKPRATDWCKISWMHQTGWVNSRYLDLG